MCFSTLRADAGLSIEEVASQFRVAAATVTAWEDGIGQPPQHIARSLSILRDLATKDKQPSSPLATEAQSAIEPLTDHSLLDRAKQSAPASESTDMAAAILIKSKQRVADHGEVFTPTWLVEKMLDLVKEETERIDSRVLEPACGSGNFLVPILQRKLAAVELKYGRSEFEKRHYALLAVTCRSGFELLA